MTPLSKKINFWFCLTQGGFAVLSAAWLLVKSCYLMIFVLRKFDGMIIIIPLVLMAFGFFIVKVGIEQWPDAPILTFGKKIRNVNKQ